ncbi:MAG TPA: hypothetical protein VGC06_06030 [Actinomycetes bacterium]
MPARTPGSRLLWWWWWTLTAGLPASGLAGPGASVVAVLLGGFDDQVDEFALAQGGQPGTKSTGWRGLGGQRGRRRRVDAEVGQADQDQVGAEAAGRCLGAVALTVQRPANPMVQDRLQRAAIVEADRRWRALLALVAIAMIAVVLALILGAHGGAARPDPHPPAATPCSAVERVGVGLDLGLPLIKTGTRAHCDTTTSTTGQVLTAAGWGCSCWPGRLPGLAEMQLAALSLGRGYQDRPATRLAGRQSFRRCVGLAEIVALDAGTAMPAPSMLVCVGGSGRWLPGGQAGRSRVVRLWMDAAWLILVRAIGRRWLRS